MTDYVVTHIWHDADGEPYVRTVPGTISEIDIAFYVADLITEAINLPSQVYAFDPITGRLNVVERPAEPTMDPEDIPKMRVLPGSNPADPPDILAAPNAGGGIGIGSRIIGGNQDTAPTSEETTDPTPE